MAATIGTNKIHRIKEEGKMSRKLLFYALVAFALAVVAGLTIRTAVATPAVVSVGHTDYDEVERIRANFIAAQSVDRSYDEVERNRSNYLTTSAEDRSYDEVERTRANFDAAKPVDTSYDEVERTRSKYRITSSTDRSYDEVERNRSGFRSPAQ